MTAATSEQLDRGIILLAKPRKGKQRGCPMQRMWELMPGWGYGSQRIGRRGLVAAEVAIAARRADGEGERGR